MRISFSSIRTTRHCERTVRKLCRILNVRVTRSTIERDLIEHPNYPTLLSVSDVIKLYGIDNLGIRVDIGAIKTIELPLLVSIAGKKVKHDLFAIVTKINETFVYLYNPETNKDERYTLAEFQCIYKGFSLAINLKAENGEREYRRNRKEEIQRFTWSLVSIVTLPLLVIIACVLDILTNGDSAIFPVLNTFIILVGCLGSILLIWYDVDQYNPLLKQICQAGRKVNCGAILSSKGAKIFGLSWTQIGASYYFGILFFLITGGISNYTNLKILFWGNVLALPYIIYSISYQKFVVKQWCVLCLTIQILLLVQFLIGVIGKFWLVEDAGMYSFDSIIKCLACFAISFALFFIMIPALKNAKDGLIKSSALQKMKHNRQIFQALLLKQKSIEVASVTGLGLQVGNRNGSCRLLKVCNPYCQPCAKAHPAVDELIDLNENIGLQIIFTAFPNKIDPSSRIARHLVSIAESGDNSLTKRALDDWYLPEKKDYEIFAKKYPLSIDIDLRLDGVKAMRDWCENVDILVTPTFFLTVDWASEDKGISKLYQLPEDYSVSDLKYILLE